MFIIDLTYLKPMDDVEKHLDAHKAFVDTGYREGYFVTSGPKVPRTGGVIVADFDSLAACKAYLAKDPFYKESIAEFNFIEFMATRIQNKSQ